MADAYASDLKGPLQFNPDGDAASVSVRWKSWIKEFNSFADCKGLFNEKPTPDTNAAKALRLRRRAMLFYCLGPAARDMFDSRPDDTTTFDKGDTDDYNKAVV